MRAFGVLLMIISGGFDIVALFLIGPGHSYESFHTVIIISSVCFFIGLLMTMFGANPNSANTNSQNNQNNTDSKFEQPAIFKDNSDYHPTNKPNTGLYGGNVRNSEHLGANEWKCKKCGNINADYVGTCACGQTKQQNGFSVEKAKTTVSQTTVSKVVPKQVNVGVSVADELLKFKELLDAGVITKEEFDAKKKELL